MRSPSAFAVILLTIGFQGNASVDATKNDGDEQRRSRELLAIGTHTMEEDGEKIVGGKPTSGQEFPFFVQADTDASGFYCGGSLVADDMVLTAAHCLNAWNSSRVLVGPYERDSTKGPAQWRKIKSKLILHPSYSEATHKYDYLMFKIEAVTKKNLKPIKLNKSKAIPGNDDKVTAIGMGTNDDNQISTVLEKVTLTAVSHADCQTAWASSGLDIDENIMVCASTTGGKDVCNGDSGGPLFDSKEIQVGLVSFGPADPCAQPALPGVYARVSGVIGWIHDNICQYSDTNPSYCKGPNPNPNPRPSSPNKQPHPRPSSGGGGGTGGPYRIEVKYDLLPWTFSWKIVDIINGDTVVGIPDFRINRPLKLVKRRFNLKKGREYKLVMKDLAGMGLQGGYLKVYRGAKLLESVDGDSIGSRKSVKFTA